MLERLYNLHWIIRGLVIFIVYLIFEGLYKDFITGIIAKYEGEKEEYDSDYHKRESNKGTAKRWIIALVGIFLISFFIINKWEIKEKDFYEEAYQKALYLISDEECEFEKGLLYLDIAIKTDNPLLKRDAYYKIGYCNDMLGDYIKAIEAYKQSISSIPDDIFEDGITYSDLGSAYDSLGLHKEAVEAYKQAISMDPISPDYDYLNLGDNYVKLGLYKDAIESFKQAIHINPDFTDAHFNLGYAYLLDGDKKSALNEYKILREELHNENEYKILKKHDIDLANKLFDLINKK